MHPEKEDILYGVEKGVPQMLSYHEQHFAELEYPFFWKAFDDLRTEAPSGMGINRIPASAIHAYATRHNMTRAGSDILDFVIRILDNHHVATQNKRMEKSSKSSG